MSNPTREAASARIADRLSLITAIWPCVRLGIDTPRGGGPPRVEIRCASPGDVPSMTKTATRATKRRFTSASPKDHNIPAPAVSVIVAVLIGGIETLGRIIDTFKLEGPFWEMIGSTVAIRNGGLTSTPAGSFAQTAVIARRSERLKSDP